MAVPPEIGCFKFDFREFKPIEALRSWEFLRFPALLFERVFAFREALSL